MNERLTEASIHRIPIFPLGMINAFLLVNASGCVLIDTGLPGTESKVSRVLKSLDLSFRDIKLIVITHAHIDHAGNTAKLKSLSGAPVVAHLNDLPYFTREKVMHFCSTGWFGWLFSKTGAIQQPYEPFQPDILLSAQDSFSLSGYGFDGEVVPTPGHTAGSISVVLDNTQAIVGDLVSSGILLGGVIRTGKAKRPPFEDNPLMVSQELQSIADRGVSTFFMGHGGPLPRQEVLRHIEKLKAIGKPCKHH
ncbi:MAG: MBL fold metallo-hydrolase [unclassified Hahellaceae]|nr:MBL fold metallo-hydrolase [Hahellaceae bacterium]